jgi:hypothetical protein
MAFLTFIQSRTKRKALRPQLRYEMSL